MQVLDVLAKIFSKILQDHARFPTTFYKIMASAKISATILQDIVTVVPDLA